MKSTSVRHAVRMGMAALVFGAGFLCGSLTQNPAQAQLGQLGRDVLKQAEGSGGILGTAAELGNTIVDMEKHVDGLQKNLDVLKKVKAALGG